MAKTIPSEDSMKTCKRCGESKPLSAFTKDYSPRLRDPDRPRYRPECRACRQREHLAWRHARKAQMTPDELAEYRKKNCEGVLASRANCTKTPELKAVWHKKDRARFRARYYRLKDAVYQAYGGYKCACCGETEPLFLSLDHVHGNGFDHRSDGRQCRGDGLYKWIIDNGFPDDFQVLCMNCNWGKGRNGGVCPHQVTRNDYPERE